MYILGINDSHDAACALLKDGEIRFVAEEERFDRRKHSWGFPANAIRACLDFEGIGIDDIDEFTFFWLPRKEITGNLVHFVRHLPRTLNLFRVRPDPQDDVGFFARMRSMTGLGRAISEHFRPTRRPRVRYVEHHLCHAASAFFVSPFTESAILTMDGRGESTSTLLSHGEGGRIAKLAEVKVPHSLGHLYAAMTDHLGFRAFFDEWKVMGMAAYGGDAHLSAFEELVELRPDGTYRLDLDYFQYHTDGRVRWLSDRFLDRFGPKRRPGEDCDQRHFDLAFAVQKVVEETGVHVARGLHERTGSPNLCLTGGVALNCLMNREIVRRTPFEHFFIQPLASDAGTSLGSALFRYHQELDEPRARRFDRIDLGPGFSDGEIEAVLRSRLRGGEARYRRSDRVAAEAAARIAEGRIVGWFQGRMEAGPRALGHRSIAADPRDPAMKDRLNARVKRREAFRPFAPAVLEERCAEFFEMPRGQASPHMILVGDVRPEKRGVLPAVTHADGSARVQTVSRDANPRFWELIHEFGALTGVPVLVNTSFNENEPIVCTPEDALACFLRAELDVLAIGDFLVEKGGSA